MPKINRYFKLDQDTITKLWDNIGDLLENRSNRSHLIKWSNLCKNNRRHVEKVNKIHFNYITTFLWGGV